eukprot:SAG31_NODE_9635_length_1248_cov_1.763272_2_plen_104_part_00
MSMLIRTSRPRPNIVLVYHAQSRGKMSTNAPGLLFSESARPAFAREDPRVNRNLRFVSGLVNHLGNSHGQGGALEGEPDPRYLGTKTSLGKHAPDPRFIQQRL